MCVQKILTTWRCRSNNQQNRDNSCHFFFLIIIENFTTQYWFELRKCLLTFRTKKNLRYRSLWRLFWYWLKLTNLTLVYSDEIVFLLSWVCFTYKNKVARRSFAIWYDDDYPGDYTHITILYLLTSVDFKGVLKWISKRWGRGSEC